MEQQLAKVTLAVCDDVTPAGMEVSKTKSVVLASCLELGRGLEKRLAKFGAKLIARAESLGAGMGAGVVRNAKVLNSRIKQFTRRAVDSGCSSGMGSIRLG